MRGVQPMGWMALKRGLSSCGQTSSLGVEKRPSRAESTGWETVLHSRIRKFPPMRRRPDKRTKVPRHILALCSGTALRDAAKSRQIVQMLPLVIAAGGSTKHRHEAQDRMWGCPHRNVPAEHLWVLRAMPDAYSPNAESPYSIDPPTATPLPNPRGTVEVRVPGQCG